MLSVSEPHDWNCFFSLNARNQSLLFGLYHLIKGMRLQICGNFQFEISKLIFKTNEKESESKEISL